MARLYADEDFPFPVVLVLRQFGHDVLTVLESGRAGQKIPDPDVLAFAISQARTVVSLNRRDFIRLHKQESQHSGIVVCTKDDDFPALAARIDAAISVHASLDGLLIRVTRPN
jgi:predicted nuclease of predicted toxin-antitoxin system